MGLKILYAGEKAVFVSAVPLLQYACPVCGYAMVMDKREDTMWCPGGAEYFAPHCSQVGIMFEIPKVTLSLKRAGERLTFPQQGG